MVSDDGPHGAAIEWLKVVLAVVTLAGLVVIYFLLPTPAEQSPLLDFIKSCITNLVTLLLVIPVVYFVLGRVGLRSEDRLIQAMRRILGSEPEAVFSNDIGDAAGLINKIVKEKRGSSSINIEILAYTGGTFTSTVLRDLIQGNTGRLRIRLHSVDFEVVDSALLPPGFEQEAVTTESRLQKLCAGGKAELEVWHYPCFPFVLGLCIDDVHLFVGFPMWDVELGRLADKTIEYRYYKRNPRNEYIFSLFANWCRQPRQTLMFPTDS